MTPIGPGKGGGSASAGASLSSAPIMAADAAGDGGRASEVGDALRVDEHRIKRLARRHEEAVALAAAETEVGAALGERDAADGLALGREHHDAVEPFAGAPAGPEVAVDVAAEAVGRSVLAAVDEDAPVRELGAV